MKKMISMILVIAMVFVLGGCVEMTKISDNEKTLISEYSATVMLKHATIKSTQLMTRKALNSAEEWAKKKAEMQSAAADGSSSDNTDKPDDNKGNESDKPSNSTPASTGDEHSLVEALGLSGIEGKYIGQQVSDTYSKDYMLLKPNSGCKLLILKFDLKNTGKDTVNLDLMKMNLSFVANVNNSSNYTNMLTILSNDLATFQGEIAAGESKELILAFSVTKSEADKVTSIALNMTKASDGQQISIKL